MVPILDLWLPILVSAVFVFIASSIIHMVLGYHRTDFKQMPSESEVMEALRKFSIPPGEYVVPAPSGPQGLKSPAYQEKLVRGPVFIATVLKSGPLAMGAQLMQWFLFCVVVGILAAYVTGRAAGPGTEYLVIFRFSGTTAFIAYTVAQWPNSIWYKRSWVTTAKNTFDGLIYSLLTAGAFGWLWPTE
jgi:hypothetical protein